MTKCIEIKGIGFPNKGADLLLSTIIDRVSSRERMLCVEPYGSFDHRKNYPLWTKLRIDLNGANVLWPLGLAPKYVRERMGWVRSSDVDFVLDASGYAYGDEWPISLAKSRVLRELPKKKIVFLPQTFGPFEKSESKVVIRQIVERAQKVFAREEKSAKEIERTCGVIAEVVPDITFGLSVSALLANMTKRDVLLIPNFQVRRRQGDVYVENLVRIVCNLLRCGREVELLNHEGRLDHDICELVASKVRGEIGRDVVITAATSGVQAKAIIGASQFLITSRYHGLISALSQGIPCVPIGWSYKYDEAMKLFDLGRVIEDIGKSSDVVGSICALTEDRDFSTIFDSVAYQERLRGVKKRVDAMWNSIGL